MHPRDPDTRTTAGQPKKKPNSVVQQSDESKAYSTLNIKKASSLDSIRRSFRSQSLLYKPLEAVIGDQIRFDASLKEAYDYFQDPYPNADLLVKPKRPTSQIARRRKALTIAKASAAYQNESTSPTNAANLPKKSRIRESELLKTHNQTIAALEEIDLEKRNRLIGEALFMLENADPLLKLPLLVGPARLDLAQECAIEALRSLLENGNLYEYISSY